VHPEHEIVEVGDGNICKKRFIKSYKKQIKIGNEIVDICKPNLSRNISMTSTG